MSNLPYALKNAAVGEKKGEHKARACRGAQYFQISIASGLHADMKKPGYHKVPGFWFQALTQGVKA